jgi:hypothetical protein
MHRNGQSLASVHENLRQHLDGSDRFDEAEPINIPKILISVDRPFHDNKV